MTLSQSKIERIDTAIHTLAKANNELDKLLSEKPAFRRRLLKPWIIYFVRAHTRRQYENLHRLCNNEILSKNGVESDIESLRKTASDLKSNYESLPSMKKFFVSGGAVLSIAVTLAAFLGFGTNLPSYIANSNWLVVLIVVSAPLMVSAIISLFVATAFQMKRYLFLYPDRARTYWKSGGPLTPSAKQKQPDPAINSIYKLEDEVYAALGSVDAKPKEIAIDTISNLWAGSIAITFFAFFFFYPTIANFVQSGGSDFRGMGAIVIYPGVYLVAFIIRPLRAYKKRLKNNTH